MGHGFEPYYDYIPAWPWSPSLPQPQPDPMWVYPQKKIIEKFDKDGKLIERVTIE